MRPKLWILVLLAATPAIAMAAEPSVQLITVDPGHFHAALIQKEMYPGVSETVQVYAPLGPDLAAHLNRIAAFNLRPENPTHWKLEVHTGPDFFDRCLRERPGNVVVLSGRNRGKIDRILASVEAGLNVLADKPWIIDAADLPKLEKALATAEKKGLVAYDVMTERYEITTILQRELVGDREVTGDVLPGTPEEPGVYMDSVHNLMKVVAGTPLLRPAWFFDTDVQGEALADVGTHLVDLVPFLLFPDQAIDLGKVHLVAARRWPTVIQRDQLLRVLGEATVPAPLAGRLQGDRFDYFCNTRLDYSMNGINVRLDVRWNYEAPAGGGDTHLAVVRGSRARVEVRQGPEQKYRTEVYVVPGQDKPAVLAAVRRKLLALAPRYPGLAVEDAGAELHVSVPDAFRTGHEAHFAEVTRRFLEYLKDPARMPRFETANMLAKYTVTTRGTELSRQGGRP